MVSTDGKLATLLDQAIRIGRDQCFELRERNTWEGAFVKRRPRIYREQERALANENTPLNTAVEVSRKRHAQQFVWAPLSPNAPNRCDL